MHRVLTMYNLIAKLPITEMKRMGYGSLFEKADIYFIYGLRYGKKAFTEIVKLKLKDTKKSIRTIVDHKNIRKVSILYEGKDGLQTCMIIRRAWNPFWRKLSKEIFVVPEMPLENGYIKVSLIGKQKALKKLVEISNRLKIKYEIIKISPSRDFRDNILDSLTEQQYKTLHTAYTLGYYSQPKKIYLHDLAKLLNISKPTLAEHLRKAEQKIMAELFIKGYRKYII